MRPFPLENEIIPDNGHNQLDILPRGLLICLVRTCRVCGQNLRNLRASKNFGAARLKKFLKIKLFCLNFLSFIGKRTFFFSLHHGIFRHLNIWNLTKSVWSGKPVTHDKNDRAVLSEKNNLLNYFPSDTIEVFQPE